MQLSSLPYLAAFLRLIHRFIITKFVYWILLRQRNLIFKVHHNLFKESYGGIAFRLYRVQTSAALFCFISRFSSPPPFGGRLWWCTLDWNSSPEIAVCGDVIITRSRQQEKNLKNTILVFNVSAGADKKRQKRQQKGSNFMLSFLKVLLRRITTPPTHRLECFLNKTAFIVSHIVLVNESAWVKMITSVGVGVLYVELLNLSVLLVFISCLRKK